MGVFSVGTRNSLLTALTGGAAYSNPAIWGQLHIGDPGAAGTANPAALTTRAQLTFGTPAASRSIANTTVTAFANAASAEDWSYWSMWSASSAGIFVVSDDMNVTASAAIGENLQIAAGGFVLTMSSSASALTDAVANAMLDAVARGISYSNAQIWVQMHTGAPGAAGSTNISSNSTRFQVSSWGAASGGTIANAAEFVSSNFGTGETITHLTTWSASTGGTFIAPHQLATPKAVIAGDNLKLPAGTLTYSIA